MTSPLVAHAALWLAGRVRWLLLLVILASTPAQAEDDEWALSIGPAFRGLSETIATGEHQFRAAPGLCARLRYGVGDFFQLGGRIDVGLGIPTDASRLALVTSALFEVHYVIDIVTWVPFLTLGLGALLRDAVPERGLRMDPVLALGGGLEYRPTRDEALGFTAGYDWMPFDGDSAFSLALVYTRFFE